MQKASRGSELFLAGKSVLVGGRMLYSPKEKGPRSRYHDLEFFQAHSPGLSVQANNKSMRAVVPSEPGDPSGKEDTDNAGG